MAVYFIVNSRVTDPEGLAAYRAVVHPTFAGHDHKLLVSNDAATTIEGTAAGPRTVVIEFPDREAFEGWYHSDAYQQVVGLRHDSTEGFAILVEGR